MTFTLPVRHTDTEPVRPELRIGISADEAHFPTALSLYTAPAVVRHHGRLPLGWDHPYLRAIAAVSAVPWLSFTDWRASDEATLLKLRQWAAQIPPDVPEVWLSYRPSPTGLEPSFYRHRWNRLAALTEHSPKIKLVPIYRDASVMLWTPRNRNGIIGDLICWQRRIRHTDARYLRPEVIFGPGLTVAQHTGLPLVVDFSAPRLSETTGAGRAEWMTHCIDWLRQHEEVTAVTWHHSATTALTDGPGRTLWRKATEGVV